MDLDIAKENIQPLATGRNASILQASILHSPDELIEKRRELEATIQSYKGDDPLEAWYNYISWIEQSFPSGGKESGLEQVLRKCLLRFESDERYYQDRRMIRIFIKFLNSCKDSAECFQQLYNAGIGTMVADFYVAWAYCYDAMGQMRKADEIFRRGIECRAEPLNELKESHQHYGFSVAQRAMYKDDEDALIDTMRQIEERRSALSSLRGYRRHSGRDAVGSIRTGAAIKSLKPGTVKHEKTNGSSTSNARVAVLTDENVDPRTNMEMNSPEDNGAVGATDIHSTTVVRSIVDKTRQQENIVEPGPWNKVHDKKNAKNLLRQKKVQHDSAFSIYEDKNEEDIDDIEMEGGINEIIIPETDLNYDKPFKYPQNFASKNRPQREWILPITTECEADPHTLPCYNKCMLYPRSNHEYQPEELRGYFYYKRRGIQNAFTQSYDNVWENGSTIPIRLYPNFVRKSKPQILDELDNFYAPPKEKGVNIVQFDKIYDNDKQEEFQLEELLAIRFNSRNNKTVIAIEDMDETMCTSSNNEQVQRRKSLFPTRGSFAVRSVVTAKLEEDTREIAASRKNADDIFSDRASTSKKANTYLETSEERQVSLKVPDAEPKSGKQENSAHIKHDQSLKSESSVVPDVMNPIYSQAAITTNDFQFKTPAVPTKLSKPAPDAVNTDVESIAQPSNKLPFEIYVEENTKTAATGIFDAEETFSTQVFNNFINPQSISTPKIAQKTQRRQLAVLQDTPVLSPPVLSSNPPESTSSVVNAQALTDDHVDMPVNAYLPQLSTILEASEPGTTQAAHSTTTSTKSTNGSQESDFPDTLQTVLPHIQHIHNTVKETSCVSEENAKSKRNTYSTVTSCIPEKSSMSSTEDQQNDIRCSEVSPPMTNKFSIYVDDTETVPKLPKVLSVGSHTRNFEPMVEHEDTAPSWLAAQPIVFFQDDKTETRTLPVQSIFPVERTETIPVMDNSLFTLKPEVDKSIQRECPMKSFSILETTANTSKKISTVPTLPITNMENLSLAENEEEDSFEFFRKSPPKGAKTAAKIGFNQCSNVSISREKKPTLVHETDVKRHYVQQTPEHNFLKKSVTESNHSTANFMKFFESHMMTTDEDGHKNENVSLIKQTPAKSGQEVVKAQNMFTECSRTEEIFQKPKPAKQDNKRDNEIQNSSLLLKGSFIAETQPVVANESLQRSVYSLNKKTQQAYFTASSEQKDSKISREPSERDSALKPFSNNSNELQNSFLPDFSIIEGTQASTNFENKSQQLQSTASKLKPPASRKSYAASKVAVDISFVPETQELQSNNSQYMQPNQNAKDKSPISRGAIPKVTKCNEYINKLDQSQKHYENNSTSKSNQIPFFELNAETDMFSNGMSMIKSSTMVSNSFLKPSRISTSSNQIVQEHSLEPIANKNRTASRSSLLETEGDMSIYFKHTPRTPKLQIHNKSWSDDGERETEGHYLHHEVDLNETNQIIQNMCENKQVNPFNSDLLNALLDQIDFVNYLHSLENTMLVGRAARLSANSVLSIKDVEFTVSKLIGEGAYGTIYCGFERKSGKKYAFKQERPPNYWEYYIGLEVQSRITNEEILPAYMNIDYALIGNNASIFVSPFSPYGSIISVCNAIKKATLKNVDEYVVMHLTCEFLEIIDHLHSTSIIHADVKADNFLLMKKLTYNDKKPSLQLIDFGVSIDMKLFKENQTFTYVHNDNAFKCVEMRENRPWTYQLDLYGLAGVIHVMLFGKYMEIEKRMDKGVWLPRQQIPRYMNKLLWEPIFRTLLNIKDCRSMPNLQQLRGMIKQEMAEKERHVINRINEFNKALGT